MPDIIDLGGAPAEAECAQLGQTADFAAVNSFEVEAYRLAIIGRFGVPPAGCRLAELANHHDFGTYRTLALHIADDAGPEALALCRPGRAGSGHVAGGRLRSAGDLRGQHSDHPGQDPIELVIGALQTCRPDAESRFALPDFEVIHGNLTRAFPEVAETARARMSAATAC